MFFNSNNYPLDKEYQTRQMQQAHREGLREQTQPHVYRLPLSFTIKRAMLFVALIVVAVALLVTGPGAQAQDTMTLADADGTASPQIEVALIMGDFYFDNGDYDKAIAQFNQAISEMPVELFELMPEQAIVFWQLGEAQEQAGYLQDALVSYQGYVELTGENATPLAHAYVEQLSVAIQLGTAETINIIGE
jgi:tetratricopeptide (TPR) repeat protein